MEEINGEDRPVPQVDEREALRRQHHVQLMSDQDEGRAVVQLPGGVYGFTYAPALELSPLFQKKSFQNFEVHKLSSGAEHVVGYVTEPDAQKLGRGGAADVTLYPDPYGEATHLVSVAVSRITNSKPNPSRERGNFLKLELAPAE